jgi:hypothetical protein
MRRFGPVLIVVAGLALSSCNREDRRNEPVARQVGRDAARTSDEIKREAEKAGKALKKTGKELREGWNEEKRDSSRPRK